MFIVTYIIWIIVSSVLVIKAMPYLVRGKYFLFTQITIFTQVAFFFLLIYFISGFFNLKLIGLFIAACELGVVINYILVGFLGSLNTQWAAHGIWTGGELGLKNRFITISLVLLCLLVTIFYPIKIYQSADSELALKSIQYTTILFLSGSLVSLPVLIGALRSENLDEDTRRRYFIAQLGNLIPTALFLSLLLWSSGISDTSFALPENMGIPLSLSPTLLIILFSFFFLAIILPYLIGSIRARKWKVILLGKQYSFFTKALDILRIPIAAQQKASLLELHAEIGYEINTFIKNDKMVYHGTRIDNNIIAKEVAALAEAYTLSRNMDPRFQYLDYLNNFSGHLIQIVNDLETHENEKEQLKKARNWGEVLARSETNIEKDLNAAKKGKLPVLITVSNTLIMLVVSALLSEVGKWIFVEMTKPKT